MKRISLRTECCIDRLFLRLRRLCVCLCCFYSCVFFWLLNCLIYIVFYCVLLRAALLLWCMLITSHRSPGFGLRRSKQPMTRIVVRAPGYTSSARLFPLKVKGAATPWAQCNVWFFANTFTYVYWVLYCFF